MDKIERYLQTVPSLYNTRTGSFIRALLEAWAESDEGITAQIEEANKQIFVTLASDKYLDATGANVGVSRPLEVNLGDDKYRQLIPILSYYPKQIRKTMYDLLDVFWGALYSRANVTSSNAETYDLGSTISLTGTLTFNEGRTDVQGTGTLFLAELTVGDWIKLDSDDNTQFTRVARIIDNNNLVLSTTYSISTTGAGSKYQSKKLNLKIDAGSEEIISINPQFFDDTSVATASEIANAINDVKGDDITASIIENPLTDTILLNIRTNTTGSFGAIQITGGTANAILGFSTDETIITDLTQKTVLYEINSRELVVRLPNVVPALRRTLKGSHHFHGNYSGTITAIDNVLKTVTVNFYDDVIANLHQNHTFCQSIYNFTIISHPAGKNGVILQFNTSDDLSTLNTSEGFTILDQTDNGFIGSFLFDPDNATFTVSNLTTILDQTISAGSVYPVITVQDASDIPDESGYLIFNFGREGQEQPIKYRGRPNNSTLLLDPAHVFTNSHASGAIINVLRSLNSTIPEVTGDDYSIYIVGVEEARLKVQSLLEEIKASGVVIRFIIDEPDYLFSQCID